VPNAANLGGRVFGLLTVKKRAGTGAAGDALWWVQCACGSPPKPVRGTALAHGQMKSCGCRRRAKGVERTPRTPAEDMKGRPFGRLRCVALLPSVDRNQGKRWYCHCAPDLGGCGGMKVVRAKDLRSGNTKSCGCLARRPTPRDSREVAGSMALPAA
jgi:hypothetical protein